MLKTWVLLLTIIGSVPLHAAKYTYLHNSRELYEVVTEDDGAKNANENVKPGFYKIEPKSGELVPLITGEVDGVNRSYKGVLSYVGLVTGTNSPHDVLSIIDGRLTLLNFNSSEKVNKSIIQFGAGGKFALPVVDVLSGSPVNLPRIEKIEDVKVFEGPSYAVSGAFPKAAKLYLVSIKGASPLGKGFTFAFFVEGSGLNDKVSVAQNRAILLGYDDIEEGALGRLVTQKSTHDGIVLYSSLIINNTKVSLPDTEEHRTMRLWRAQLDRFLSYLHSGKNVELKEQLLRVGVPYYDPINRKIVQSYLPFERVTSNPDDGASIIAQVYDPFTRGFSLIDLSSQSIQTLTTRIGNAELEFLDREIILNRRFSDQAVDRLPKTNKFLMFGLTNVPVDNAGLTTGNPIDETRHAFIFFSHNEAKIAIRRKDNTIQVLNWPMEIRPTDKVALIRKKVELSDRILHVFLISRQGARAQKAMVSSFIVEETSSLRPLRSENIYETQFIGAAELTLRLRNVNNELLFDNITTAHGPVSYLRAESLDNQKPDLNKHVPYWRLFRELPGFGNSSTNQQYIRALAERTLISDQLFYREYEPRGAQFSATGFYLRERSNGKEKPAESVLSGYPLFSEKEKGSSANINHISDSMILRVQSSHSEALPDIKVSLFPFAAKPLYRAKGKAAKEKAAKEISSREYLRFNLGIALTGSGIGSEQTNGTMHHIALGAPYPSLAFTKIIQGVKNHADDFHILMFFREDPKTPGSMNVVAGINGRINRTALGQKRIEINWGNLYNLYQGVVAPSEVKNHLKTDADGNYYWDQDPSLPTDSPKKVVRKLWDPAKAVQVRTFGGLQLREADHLNESEVGVTNKNYRRGGKWELYGRDQIRNRVRGMMDAIEDYDHDYKKSRGKDKDKEKQNDQEEEPKKFSKADLAAENMLLQSFEEYLDKIASDPKANANGFKVILVEQHLKEKFRTTLFKRLLKTGDVRFSLRASKFNFYYADGSLNDVEVADEMQFIAERPDDRRKVLYIESEFLKQMQIVSLQVKQREEKENEKPTDSDYDFESGLGHSYEPEAVDPRKVFRYDQVEAPASFIALLASGGKAKTVKGFKRLGSPKPALPALIISTPQEWRDIQVSSHNHVEYENGLFDNFELNLDYLTASWTLWPPATDRSVEEVRQLSKTAYNVEEMRVFPTLDGILESAAKGQRRGKQTIIVVPPELKAIVHKLVLLRWSTNDVASAGAWSHQNKNLVLFRMNGKDPSQAQIQDNFRAISGASTTRNAVLYSDLETIERMGRPLNSNGKNFYLKDPIKTKKGLLETSDGAEAEQADQPEQSENASAEEELTYEQVQTQIYNYNAQIEDLNMRIQEFDTRLSFVGRTGTHLLSLEEQRANLKTQFAGLIHEREAALKVLAQMENRDVANDTDTAGTQVPKNANWHFPHALWWIGAEGKALQPKRTKGWSLASAVNRNAATILIGTEEELARLEGDMAFENRFFNIREHFEVTHLQPPSSETKFKLVNALFDRPDVTSLGLQFALKDSNGREPRSQLIHHFFNRVDQIAYDLKIEKTTAFVKAFTALKNSLSENLELRRSRRIDEHFIERIFTNVFPMPLNVDILDKTDPLQKVKNADTAVRDLEKEGYTGSRDLKRRLIENIWSQTRPTDSSKPIPNSQILFGKTSKGKTFLIECLFRMLNLIEYKASQTSNAEADYIFINVAKLTADEGKDPDKTSVSKMIDNIYDLLSQPKGPRAHILFDDFHKATSVEVRRQLFQFIQGLFEAKNGMITVRSKDGKRVREIPVQNLNVYMTLNPTSNEATRSQFIRNNQNLSPADILKREVLAAISEKGFEPEESVLARWSDIINIDNFPRSAKVPELGKRVRTHSRAGRHMILVEPNVIDALVTKFEDANARELLAPAAAALTHVPSSAAPSLLYVVSKRESLNIGGRGEEAAPEIHGQINSQELGNAVRKLTQIDPVKIEEPRSMLRYMSFVLQNFRLQVFNNLALEAHMSDTLRLEKAGMINLVKMHFLLGAATHVLDKPELAVTELTIRPEHLAFLNRGQTEEFYAELSKMKKLPHQPHFPARFGQRDSNDLDLASFIDGKSGAKVQPHNRKEVIAQFVGRAEVILAKVMQHYLRLQSVSELSEISRWKDANIRRWFDQLQENNPDAQVRALMTELLELFMDFQIEFESHELDDLVHSAKPISIYEEVRVFAYIIDKAISIMPWSSVSKMTFDVVQMSSDLSLGTKTAFKEYIGTHEISPFAITTPEFMTDMMSVAQTLGAPKEGALSKLKQNVNDLCADILSVRGGGK